MNSKEKIEIVAFGSKGYHQALALRDKILRKPLGMVFSEADLAKEDEDVHIICKRGNIIVGCLVLTERSPASIKMRQVAVDNEFQGKGIGTKLLLFSENYARKQGYHEMYCHARDVAKPFYLKHGYSIDGAPFVEVSITHFKMNKKL